MKCNAYNFVNSYELYGKLVNGIITFLILSGIVNKEMKKEKGIQHETFKRPLMDMSGKESHSLYDLVLSELAITWLCPSLYWT